MRRAPAGGEVASAAPRTPKPERGVATGNLNLEVVGCYPSILYYIIQGFKD